MIPDYFYPITVGLFLAVVIAVYFSNNPLRHGNWFMMRRFINWLPLGMTYAFLYMGRYNLIVAKSALGSADVQPGYSQSSLALGRLYMQL